MSAHDHPEEIPPALDQELNRLPSRYRVPLVLCYLKGLTHDQAAEELRCPVGTVRSRLARGRDLLKRRLTARGYAPSASLSGIRLAGPGSPRLTGAGNSRSGGPIFRGAGGCRRDGCLGRGNPGGRSTHDHDRYTVQDNCCEPAGPGIDQRRGGGGCSRFRASGDETGLRLLLRPRSQRRLKRRKLSWRLRGKSSPEIG